MQFVTFKNHILREMGEYSEAPSSEIVDSIVFSANEALHELSAMQPWSWWAYNWEFPVAADTEELSLPHWIQWPGRMKVDGELYDARTADRQTVFEDEIENKDMNSYSMGQVRMRDFYSTGTASVTAADTTVTGSGTTFTEEMVGRVLYFSNGDSYLITGFTSATEIEIDMPALESQVDSTFKVDPRGTRTLKFVPAIQTASNEAIMYCYRKPFPILADDDIIDMQENFISWLHWAVRSKMTAYDEERQYITKDMERRANNVLRRMRKFSTDELQTVRRTINAYAF